MKGAKSNQAPMVRGEIGTSSQRKKSFLKLIRGFFYEKK